jgi:hypothetical protein
MVCTCEAHGHISTNSEKYVDGQSKCEASGWMVTCAVRVMQLVG